MQQQSENFRKVQKLVKEGKISDHVASLHAAFGTAPKEQSEKEKLRECIENRLIFLSKKHFKYEDDAETCAKRRTDEIMQLISADRQQAIAQAVEEATFEELINIQRELNKAEIAGAVKWYVEDRLAQLQQKGEAKQ